MVKYKNLRRKVEKLDFGKSFCSRSNQLRSTFASHSRSDTCTNAYVLHWSKVDKKIFPKLLHFLFKFKYVLRQKFNDTPAVMLALEVRMASYV